MKIATPFIAPDSTLFQILDLIADATNPLLIVWLLAVLIIGTRRKVFGGKIWLAVLLSVALVYLVKTVDSRFDLWQSAELDYSTHSALAAALTISLFFLDWPRRILALVLLAAYELLLVVLGFHSVADILTTLAVVAPPIILLHFFLGKKPQLAAAQT